MTISSGTIETPPADAARGPTARRWTVRSVAIGVRRLFWPVVVALVALNGWWFHDRRDLPELRRISGMIEAGQSTEAESSLRLWLKRSPHYGEARLMLARLLAGRNDLQGCAEQLRAVPFWSRLKPDALFREGQTWLSVDRARDAERAFRGYIADDPNHPVAKPFQAHAEVELMNLLTLENRFEDVRALIQASIPRSEGKARQELLILNLRTLLERWSPAAAYRTLSRYVAADPSDIDARLALAVNAQMLGKPAESDAHLEVCLRSRPDDPTVWRTWLGILQERGDLEAMRAALAGATRSPSVDQALWPYKGQVLAQGGALAEAFDAYARAIAARPFEAESYYSFALLARRLGRIAEERDALKRHAALRKAREALPDALAAFAKARDEPGGTPADLAASCRRLSWICKELGWESDAREWARFADESQPQPS